jgi:hypothetical protein
VHLPHPLEFISGGNRYSPAHAEGLGGDLQARGGLAALVFIPVNGADHPLHRVRLKPQLDDIPVSVTLGEVIIHDLVQDLVGGQGVLVLLVRAQLR